MLLLLGPLEKLLHLLNRGVAEVIQKRLETLKIILITLFHDLVQLSRVTALQVLSQEAYTENTSNGNMRRAHRQTQLRCQNNRKRSRQCDTEGTGLIQLGNFAAHGFDQARTKQHPADR